MMFSYKLDTQTYRHTFANKASKNTNNSKPSQDIENLFQKHNLFHKSPTKFPYFLEIKLKAKTTIKGYTLFSKHLFTINNSRIQLHNGEHIHAYMTFKTVNNKFLKIY